MFFVVLLISVLFLTFCVFGAYNFRMLATNFFFLFSFFINFVEYIKMVPR